MILPPSSQPVTSDVRQVLGAFYKTLDVMKSAHGQGDRRLMSVWDDDLKAAEGVVAFLEAIRDAAPAPRTEAESREAREPVVEQREALRRGSRVVFPAYAGEIRGFADHASDTNIKDFFAALSPGSGKQK